MSQPVPPRVPVPPEEVANARRHSFTPRPNRILAALPAADQARLEPDLTREPLAFEQTLYRAEERITRVYFPESGVCSLTLTMEDGRTVEVGTVGYEGIVGLPLVFGAAISPSAVICQVQGQALVMTADAFSREMRAHGALFMAAAAYAQVFNLLTMQSAACNRLHSVEERLGRWLLMTRDRLGTDRFPLTQQFIAYMLGVHRPSVTLVARTLQKAGLIQYERGIVTILDVPGLESATCECYRAVNAHFDSIEPLGA